MIKILIIIIALVVIIGFVLPIVIAEIQDFLFHRKKKGR